MKAFIVSVFLFLLATNVFVEEVVAAGECGRTPIRSAATSLSPCLSAARNVRAKVPPLCCTKVGALIKTTPKCLCAVLLSPLAKQAVLIPPLPLPLQSDATSGNDLPERSAEGTWCHKPKSEEYSHSNTYINGDQKHPMSFNVEFGNNMQRRVI